ncbi:MAG: hypothetical protein QX198_02165 [Methylococcaceae bacterium]
MSKNEIDWDDSEPELTTDTAINEGVNTVSVEIDGDIFAEFEYLLTLLKKSDNADGLDNTADLINYILMGFADGSRRPGSWERGMLDSMSLVADCEEHQAYRENYGDPKPTQQ